MKSTLTEYLRGLLYPFKYISVLLISLLFLCFIYGWLYVLWSMIIFAVVSIPVVAIIATTYLKYMTEIAIAAADKRKAPVLSNEALVLLDGMKNLQPALWGLVMLYLYSLLAEQPVTVITMVLLAAYAVALASVCVFVLTNSLLESINPRAIMSLLQHAGWRFLLLCLLCSLLWLVVFKIGEQSLWKALLLTAYVIPATFVLVGITVDTQEIADHMDIDLGSYPNETCDARNIDKERRNTLTRAYGFVSRGNRSSGLKDLIASANASDDPRGAALWFHNQICTWDDSNVWLLHAQHYLRLLLRDGDADEAVKLAIQCLTENERWKPYEEEGGQLIKLLQERGHQSYADCIKRNLQAGTA